MTDHTKDSLAPDWQLSKNMADGFLSKRDNINCKYSSQIDELFESYNKLGSPGCILAVIKDGDVIHQSGYGVANIEHNVPFSQHTVLRMGSTSKHLCAAAVSVLIEQGKVKLDDNIRDYIPELPDYEEVVTVGHLLSMTSGMPDGLGLVVFSGLPLGFRQTRQQIINQQINFKNLMFRPGTEYCYSNTNYILLTEMIERVSGTDLGSFLRKYLFSPLGMNSTELVPEAVTVIPNKAAGYTKTEEGFEAGFFLNQVGGEGGVDTTIGDLVTWFKHYRNDRQSGGPLTAFLEQDVRLFEGRLSDYRHGIMVNQYRNLTKISHPGGMPGYLCDFTFFPDQDLGVVLLTNVSDANLLTSSDKIADIILEQDIQNLQPQNQAIVEYATDDDFKAVGLDGGYACVDTGYLVEFINGNCYLMGEDTPLLRENANRFSSAKRSTYAEITRQTSDAPHWNIHLGGPEKQILRPFEPKENRPPKINDFVAEYYSEVLQETHHIYEKDGLLNIEILGMSQQLLWQELSHCVGDVFAAAVTGAPTLTNISLRFSRNEASTVDGFFYKTARMKELFFRRLH